MDVGRLDRRVLVAEDEPLIRMIWADVLRDAGLQVVEVASGREAIAALEEGGPFSAVVTDVNMPGGVDGLAVAQRAKQLYPSVTVFVVSGGAHSAARLAFADSVIQKPFSPEQLAEVVLRSLNSNTAQGRRQYDA